MKDYLQKKEKEYTEYYSGLGHQGEALIQVVNENIQFSRSWYLKIEAALKGDRALARELYPYFENLSANRDTAYIFRTISGIATGSTNKSGIEAFKKAFPGIAEDIEKERLDQARAQKQEAKETKVKAKEQEEKQTRDAFASSVWDIDSILALKPMQLGRLTKSLSQLYRWSDGSIKSLQEKIEYEYQAENLKQKTITDKMCKWNSRKFNAMDGDEQREYERKLKNGRLYHYETCEDILIEIPKVVYDVLQLKEVSKNS